MSTKEKFEYALYVAFGVFTGMAAYHSIGHLIHKLVGF